MLRNFLIGFFFLFFLFNSFSQKNQSISFSKQTELPAIQESQPSIGLAGMVGGFYKNQFIVAGGANFPNGYPWNGGEKQYYPDIYSYKNANWEISPIKFPVNLAYSSSLSTDKGIYIFGGENQQDFFDSIWLMGLDDSTNSIFIEEIGKLPIPLSNASIAQSGSNIYISGGRNKNGSLNTLILFNLETQKSHILSEIPFHTRAFHSSAIQETNQSKKLFLIGGREEFNGAINPLPNWISFDLNTLTWSQEFPIEINSQEQLFMGAVSRPSGSMHILTYGGSQQGDIITDKKILENHPGFSNKIVGFNTLTNKWFIVEEFKESLPVTSLGINTQEDFYLFSGEKSPGIRTPAIYKITSKSSYQSFGLFNYFVVAVYLLISLLIGLYFSKRQKSTNDYFKGGGRIPWWASGLSVFGTLLSAITFMAIPAKSFSTDWSYFLLNIAAILIAPVIALIFIPFFNKLNIKTAYEFLEIRFNYAARFFGSFSFILFQIGRIGIVLLLPSIAISIVTGVNLQLCILIMGLLCIAYTYFGGIEAVIWTDVLQVIVLMGGSIIALFWLVSHIEMNGSQMLEYAKNHQKFNWINLDLSFTETSFWVVIVGGLASAMVTQGTDQTIVQRYLTSNNLKDSQKTLYTNSILTLPSTLIFFSLGTLLFIFYSEKPSLLSVNLPNNDAIFPWYIVHELPQGVSGLLIAGIFSAAMSSISSSLNSVSTAYCNDIHLHFKSELTDGQVFKIARWTTLITGLIGIIFALWMSYSTIKSLWDQFYTFLGLFTGGLGGMFLLGILSKKAHGKGAMIGLAISGIVLLWINQYTQIHILLYSLIGVGSCYIFGLLFSLILKDSRKNNSFNHKL